MTGTHEPGPTNPGRRYWVMRSDRARIEPLWAELSAGRLRQGWGSRPDQDLHMIEDHLRRGVRLNDYQRSAWRGNRRLLGSQPGAVRLGDLVVTLHLPRPGVFSVVEVTGPYRYEISDIPNTVDGRHDYGHILPVTMITHAPIATADAPISNAFARALGLRPRMWNIDRYGGELLSLLDSRDTPIGSGTREA